MGERAKCLIALGVSLHENENGLRMRKYREQFDWAHCRQARGLHEACARSVSGGIGGRIGGFMIHTIHSPRFPLQPVMGSLRVQSLAAGGDKPSGPSGGPPPFITIS